MKLQYILFILLLCPVLVYSASTESGAPMTYQYGNSYYAFVPDGGAMYTEVKAGAKYIFSLNETELKQILVNNITKKTVSVTVQYSDSRLFDGQTKYYDLNNNGIVDLELAVYELNNDTISLVIHNWESKPSAPLDLDNELDMFIEKNRIAVIVLFCLLIFYYLTNRTREVSAR